MHTVEQAKELWCPMVRIARREVVATHCQDTADNLAIVGGCNTDALGKTRVPASCRCIGEQCAMWRWSEDRPMRKIVPASSLTTVPHPKNFVYHDADENEGEPARYIETEESADARRRGYCGLANRPNY